MVDTANNNIKVTCETEFVIETTVEQLNRGFLFNFSKTSWNLEITQLKPDWLNTISHLSDILMVNFLQCDLSILIWN